MPGAAALPPGAASRPPGAPSGRFAHAVVREVTAPDGSARRVVALGLDRAGAPGSGVHRVVAGDAVDGIARRYLGDESLWWKVLDANPVRHPLDLVPGEVLRLPDPGPATRARRTRSF
jgi:nucleoid-associated protein YgaU